MILYDPQTPNLHALGLSSHQYTMVPVVYICSVCAPEGKFVIIPDAYLESSYSLNIRVIDGGSS